MDPNQTRFTWILTSLLILLGFAYLVRVMIAGRAKYERVEKQGSALLSKTLMEMTYWSMQPVTRFLIRLRVTPNQITWASLALAVAAATQLAQGFFGTGAALATASALLDLLDGSVARLSDQTSPAGVVLDSSIDRYSEFLFLGSVLYYYRTETIPMLLALAALLGSFMVSYSTAKSEALRIPLPNRGLLCAMRRPERAFYLIFGAAVTPLLYRWNPSPLVLAMGLVAIVSNIAAAARLTRLAQLANRAEAVTRLSSTRSIAVQTNKAYTDPQIRSKM